MFSLVIFRALQWFLWRKRATTAHGLHSPWVFKLYNRCINADFKYYAFDSIEALRLANAKSKQLVSQLDFGGADNQPSTVLKQSTIRQRSVASITKVDEKPKSQAQTLFRIVEWLKPNVIFDFGTSLGITTAYLAAANTSSQVITFEGAPEIATLAGNHFKNLGLSNVVQVVGDIGQTLPNALKKFGVPDFAFLDANHRLVPTLAYFNMLMASSESLTNDEKHKVRVFVFDDIYHSKEMEVAWTAIKADPRINCTIDLYWCGLVVLNPDFKEKQHFSLRR